MTIPTRPYLIRAFYDWIIDNDWVPHIVVDVDSIDVELTQERADSGQIVLNISPSAVKDLTLNNDCISFKARFNSVSKHIMIPVESVVAIYAKENGRGMVFAEEGHDDDFLENDIEEGESSDKGKGGSSSSSKGKKDRSHLTVVK